MEIRRIDHVSGKGSYVVFWSFPVFPKVSAFGPATLGECERWIAENTIAAKTPRDRLEELRAELRAERMSYDELAELQSLAAYIDAGDVELLEAAGIPEGATHPDVWRYAENAPEYATATADLWHWSTNYDAGKGPFTVFLDLIGWSEENIGEPLYDMRPASLGYLELGKLAAALEEYATRPGDVLEWVEGLLAYDGS